MRPTLRPAPRLLPRPLFLLFALLAWFAPLRADTDVVGVYLTWLRDPATTMVVNWVNLYPKSSVQVWHRAAGEEKWSSTWGLRSEVPPSTFLVRRAVLTGLTPDTIYEFSLGGDAAPAPGEKWRVIERFRTPPAKLDRRVRFVTGGDMMHLREWLDAMNRQAGAQDPDFALLGGDLAYADGKYATRWIDWLQSVHRYLRAPDGRLIPLVLVIGNHEVRGHYNGRIPDDAPYFYGFFALPENRSYNALDFGDYLSVIALDTDHTQPIAGAQTAWLDAALAERATRRFVFPCYHYPAYGTTNPPKEGGLPSEHPLAQKIQREWSPLFERHGVTAVFENDHHAYKRTYPIRAGARDDANGVTYLGDGAWGVETRPVATPEEAWYLARSESRRHLFVVTLQPEGVAQVRASDAEGEIFDRVTFETARMRPPAP